MVLNWLLALAPLILWLFNVFCLCCKKKMPPQARSNIPREISPRFTNRGLRWRGVFTGVTGVSKTGGVSLGAVATFIGCKDSVNTGALKLDSLGCGLLPIVCVCDGALTGVPKGLVLSLYMPSRDVFIFFPCLFLSSPPMFQTFLFT